MAISASEVRARVSLVTSTATSRTRGPCGGIDELDSVAGGVSEALIGVGHERQQGGQGQSRSGFQFPQCRRSCDLDFCVAIIERPIQSFSCRGGPKD